MQIKNETDEAKQERGLLMLIRDKYERDMLLMLILDEEEFGPGAFERAVEKVKAWRERKN